MSGMKDKSIEETTSRWFDPENIAISEVMGLRGEVQKLTMLVSNMQDEISVLRKRILRNERPFPIKIYQYIKEVLIKLSKVRISFEDKRFY